MERDDLIQRWHELIHEPVSADSSPSRVGLIHDHLHERLTILHRLNELGQYQVEGIPIEQALEDTNVLIRDLDFRQHAHPPQDASVLVTTCLGEVYGAENHRHIAG